MQKANKVILNTETLIDLTSDDTVESDVAAGKKFHRYDGVECIGTKEAPSGTVEITLDKAPDSETSIDVTNTKYVTVPGAAEDTINNLTFDEGGQMEYASDSYFIRKVIIKKPDTLLPENIKQGIAIAGISGELQEGIIPSGTLQITQDGIFDVTQYASAEVNVEAEDSAIPIEVSSEADMTALLENGEVSGVYKYTGESTEVYESGALYVLEALPDALAGTWVFNDTSMVYANGLTAGTGWLVNFVMDALPSISFMGLEITEASSTSDQLWTLSGVSTDGRMGAIIDYHGGQYWWEVGISMTITSTLAEVENGDTLLAWLQTNATKQ